MSRYDDIGLFWEDLPPEKGEVYRPQPPIPDTGWQRPTHYPDLSSAKIISLDLETKDPHLKKRGPGWARGDGHIIGVAIGTDDGYRGYFPIRHEIEPEWNLDPNHVMRWLRDALSNPNQHKIGANITYDVGWLEQEKVFTKGLLIDVQFAEALLDADVSVALDTLSHKYLGVGKETSLLYQWLADFYGGKPNGDQRKNLWRSPPRLCGPYAISDIDRPLRIWAKQAPLLEREGLMDLFRMECDLIRVMIAMRFKGVTVDINKTEQLTEEFTARIKDEKDAVKKETGIVLNCNNKEGSLVKLFDHYGIPVAMTKAGNPSFKKEVMEAIEHPFAARVLEVRSWEKFNSTFLNSYILDSHVDGKVHGQFHQMKGESGGTGYGRFSSSTPNLQNIPSRNKIWAPKIRGLFIPDPGDVQWRRHDYSQVEYRLLAHFAIGKGAHEIRAQYHRDPNTDYHDAIVALIKAESGISLDRKPAKTINFGLIYGMQIKTLSIALGMSLSEATHLFQTYHAGVPFAQVTMDACTAEAEKFGLITTILGRRARFNKWEPAKWQGKQVQAYLYDQARQMYGHNIKRAKTFVAINNKLQGSSADIIKKGMLDCWQQGIYDVTGVPRLQVHDELNFSDNGRCDEAFEASRRVLENCVPLSIPLVVDEEIGPDWGHCKATKKEAT